MAFDMTKQPTGKGNNGPRFIPTNVPIKAGQHLATLCTYVELGEHSQATDKYPEKGTAPEAAIEFEFPELEHTFDPAKGAQPLREGRVFPLYTSDKANSYKFFMALTACLSDSHARATGMNPVPKDTAVDLPTYGDLGVSTFEEMLLASALVVVSNKTGTRTFKNCLPAGTTLDMVKAAKEAGSPIRGVPVQQVPWTWSNIAPHGVGSTMNPAFGAALVDLHPNSVGITRFLWDHPTAEDWATLYPWMQTKIKAALNYPGSDVEAMVLSLEQAEQHNAPAPTQTHAEEEEDLGPAFPSEASSMDDIPF